VTLLLPYLASCTIAGEHYTDLEVTDLTKHTCKVKLPNGDIVKRHIEKHNVKIVFVRPE
jgi:hypothetical protein